MDLESQVVSLELSKQLKEAGYKQEGLWWWHKKGKHYFETRKIPAEEPYLDRCNQQMSFPDILLYVAPTIAELLFSFKHKGIKQQEIKLKYVGGVTSLWFARCYPIDWCSGNTPQEALAKCWKHSKKENLI